jgi:hypothetical protein
VRKGVETPAQGYNPVAAPKMMESLQEIGFLESYPRGKIPGAFSRENSVALGGQEPDQFDAQLGSLYIAPIVHLIISNLNKL